MTDEVEITESTVGRLGDVRVGAGSIFAADYALPDGSTRHGLTCRLVPADDETPRVVGEGSEVEIGGTRWLVVRVTASGDEPFDYGEIALRPASGASAPA
jgi:hypothetical protein